VLAQIKPRNHTYNKGGERIKELSGITSTHPMITPQENDSIRMHISQLYNLQEKNKTRPMHIRIKATSNELLR